MKNNIFKAALIAVIIILTYQFGVKPWLSQFEDKKGRGWADGRITHETGRYDVIIAGEDPEGIAAALSSSRLGAKTLLLAEGKDLGGIVSRSMVMDFETNYDNSGNIVNKGILSEFKKKLGTNYSIDDYVSTMKELVEDEKNLDVVYNAKIDSVEVAGNSIKGVKVSVEGKGVTYYGKRFVDATGEGLLLKACGEPYFTGSEDLNLKNSYMAAKLNFEIGDVDWDNVQHLINSYDEKFSRAMEKYQSSNVNIRVNNIRFFSEGSKKLIVQGLEVINLDQSNDKAVQKAYGEAQKEVKNLIIFLKEFKEFNSISSYRIAKSFYFRESKHFIGEQTLGVNDILENRDFAEKIAMGAYPVEIGKFSGTRNCIAGKPYIYAIPLGCIIPFKTDNLLMVGRKISYSSIASSSAGSMSVNVTTGESAGVVSVYSLVKDITPREILKQKDKSIAELEDLLKRVGVYLPDIKIKKQESSNWSYSAVRQLNSLGLLEGGINNDYAFNREATQKDMVTLLIDGIYRLSADKYSIDLSVRLSPYVKKDKITPEICGEILLSLYHSSNPKGNAYSRACQLGLIDKPAQVQMNKKKYLTMDDIYNLSVNNLRRYTGKNIPD